MKKEIDDYYGHFYMIYNNLSNDKKKRRRCKNWDHSIALIERKYLVPTSLNLKKEMKNGISYFLI